MENFGGLAGPAWYWQVMSDGPYILSPKQSNVLVRWGNLTNVLRHTAPEGAQQGGADKDVQRG